jgi:hypothetical protein
MFKGVAFPGRVDTWGVTIPSSIRRSFTWWCPRPPPWGSGCSGGEVGHRVSRKDGLGA